MLYSSFIMKPLIGLNLDIVPGPPEKAELQTTYFDWILSHGGIPILVPPIPEDDLQEVLARLGGLVLIGGDDYSPSLYGEKPGAKLDIMHPRREDFDLRLIAQALKRRDFPILGICG